VVQQSSCYVVLYCVILLYNLLIQTGHHVERRFGWDCHGLPVEYEIDQTLGIKGREDVLEMGIRK
jgi:isoleucyl-tRNA synthetase